MTISKAYISKESNKLLKDYLKSLNIEVIEVSKNADVSDAISCHPDVYYCLLKDRLYKGDPTLLKKEYPGDVLYNAAAVGKYLICSKFTSKDLIKESGLIPVIVPQGYVKCNLSVLDDHHVITEDKGIAKVLKDIPDIDCLLINPHEVLLPGFEYGFIGGASGRAGNKMIFNGNLKAHSCFGDIRAFCIECSLDLVYFESYPLTDIGSKIVV